MQDISCNYKGSCH